MKEISLNAASRVRCIILQDNAIWIIKRERIKNGKKLIYYVFPGGGIEEGETPEEAAKREAMEELGVEVEVVRKLYDYEHDGQINDCFLCNHVSGTMGTGAGPEFNDKAYKTRGSYSIMCVPISKISQINLVPHEIRDKLIQDFQSLI